MKAVILNQHGDIDKLQYTENFPKPEIAPNEVLVQVKATALNHLDLWIRSGLPTLKLQMPHILGSDVAGEIVETGDLVENVKTGDKVLLAPGWGCGCCGYCLTGDDNLCSDYKILGENVHGGYAEYVKVPAANAFLIPAGINFEDAAAIPLVFLTAWHMLIDQAIIKPGEDVLVHAAGSGVGSAA